MFLELKMLQVLPLPSLLQTNLIKPLDPLSVAELQNRKQRLVPLLRMRHSNSHLLPQCLVWDNSHNFRKLRLLSSHRISHRISHNSSNKIKIKALEWDQITNQVPFLVLEWTKTKEINKILLVPSIKLRNLLEVVCWEQARMLSNLLVECSEQAWIWWQISQTRWRRMLIMIHLLLVIKLRKGLVEANHLEEDKDSEVELNHLEAEINLLQRISEKQEGWNDLLYRLKYELKIVITSNSY
jgi:hypothetical protein